MTTKQKILVLENVSHLDRQFSEYLNTLKDADIKILYSIANSSRQEEITKEIKTELSKCDILCVCSSFANKDQLRKFAKLIPNFPNIKEVRILYLYTKVEEERAFLRFLNQKIDKELFNDIANIVKSEKVQISEIFYRELIDEHKEYFNSTTFYYDTVPLYFNEEYKLLWHIRVPHVIIPGNDLYLDQKYIQDFMLLDKSGLIINIAKEDMNVFSELINEFRAVINYQIESCESQDFGDSAKLIAEKEHWLQLLNKYKL